MKATAFDGITRELGAVATRRGFFRLLGGAATVGAGLTLTVSELTQAKARARGKARGQELVKAQGKGKKITICYQGNPRKVSKRGWQDRYPGATKGACTGGAVCTSWILSGGPDRTTLIAVDDDLQVMVNGVSVINDTDGKASSLPPVTFTANVGDSVGVIARDAVPSCRSLSPLWLHCATSGQKRQLSAGNNDGCAPGRTAGTFFSEVYTISL